MEPIRVIMHRVKHSDFKGKYCIGERAVYLSWKAHNFFDTFSFSPVVLLLKVLLSQQALDKPFTGGLGSYKLYVLVAHHVSQCVTKHVELPFNMSPRHLFMDK